MPNVGPGRECKFCKNNGEREAANFARYVLYEFYPPKRDYIFSFLTFIFHNESSTFSEDFFPLVYLRSKVG